jgi:putative intracellular protease/amidase
MHRVGLIVPAGFHVMSYAALATFDTANYIAGEAFYDVNILSENGGAVPNSFGTTTETLPLDVKPFDTLLIGAGLGVTSATPKLSSFLREAVKDARRVASICVGAFILAEAGILDGRRATTHWAFAQELAQRFPKVRVEMDRIFIADGPVWTSAGMTAGIDMALGLVERDMGENLAHATAKMMVVHHRRAGGPAGSHSIRPCFNSMRKPIASRTRSPLRRRICARPLESSNLPKRRAQAPGNSPACCEWKPVNRLRAPSRIFDSRPLATCSNMVGCRSRKLPGKPDLWTGNECAAASCAPMVKPPRPYAEPLIRSPQCSW